MKLTVNPSDIRGLGNIVEEKSLSDLRGLYCTLVKSSDTVDGLVETVWVTDKVNTAYSLTVTAPKSVSVHDESFDVKVKINTGTVYFRAEWNNTVYTSSSAKSTHTFTLPIDMVGANTVYLSCSSTSEGTVLASSVIPIVILDGSESLEILNGYHIIRKSATDDIFARHLTSDGDGIDGAIIRFYEEYYPTFLNVLFGKKITSTGDSLDIQASLRDEDGSAIEGKRVNFYEEYNASRLTPSFNPRIIQIDDSLDMLAELVDEDGSMIVGRKVDFYEDWEGLRFDLTAPDCGVDMSTDIKATVKDGNGSPVINQTVHFYESYTPTRAKVNIPSKIIKVNDSMDFTASVLDDDGSIIRVPDEVIGFYRYWPFDLVITGSTKSIVTAGESTVLSMVLTDENDEPIPNAEIKLYADNPNFVTLKASKSVMQSGETNTLNMKLFDGSGESMAGKEIKVYADNPNFLTLKASKQIMQTGETNTLTVRFYDGTGESMVNKEIKIYREK